MKQFSAIIILALLILFNFSQASAEWEPINKNLDKKSREEFYKTYSDKTLDKLNKMISAEGDILNKELDKLIKTNRIINKTSSKITINNELILSYKRAFRKELSGKANAAAIKHHNNEIKRLMQKNKSLKKSLLSEMDEAKRLTSVTSKLKQKLSKMGSAIKYVDKAGNLIKYNDAAGAGFGVMGEIAAWYEGNSSFKNVVLRAAQEGGKAAVSIGSGAISGTITTALSFNPIAGGGAAVASAVAAEELYDATIGRSFDKLMDSEHDAINQYAADPEKLEKLREANRKKAFEENKRYLEDLANKQDAYNNELKRYIEERNNLWAAFEQEIKEEESRQLAIEKEQKPSVAQTASKKKIKPGETVTITIETTGGLLPITYSGALSYKVENGYDRYLISYQWTADKKAKPGIYDFTVRAKSASGKVGRNTVSVEVVRPEAPPAPIKTKSNNDEKTYKASDLNIVKLPNEDIRKKIYAVNGIYYGHCKTPSNIKTQRFEIALGVDPNVNSKLGLAHLSQLFGSRTFPLSKELIEKLRKKFPYLPEKDRTKTGKVYFNVYGRDQHFDPISGRIWGELSIEASPFETFIPKSENKGNLEAKLSNGVITGTITFTIAKYNYSFPFTARQ